jgi:hypothetical protein
MALGAKNRQQMAPAQFVGQFSPEGLVRPGDYSRLNFDASVPVEGYARMAQDAMQKQAEFEAAYQEQQNNMGWDLVSKLQGVLEKGAQTAERMEQVKSKARDNELGERFDAQDRLAALQKAQTDAEMTKFDLDLKRKYGEEDAQTGLEKIRAQTEELKQDTLGKTRENELLNRYGERKLIADIEATEAATETQRNTLAQANIDRNKKQALLRLASDEARRIHKLYESAMIGESAAYDRLSYYSVPADLLEDPKLFEQLKQQLDAARQNAFDSRTLELAKKSRLGYETFAQNLYTDGPKGQALAARVKGILNQTPGFLTADQIEAIQNAYEIYKTKINPSTKVELPEIVDTEKEKEEARDADRKALARPPLPDSTVNSFIRSATTILGDPDSTQTDKDLALGIIRTIAGQNRQILDPKVLELIRLQNSNPTGTTGAPKPNAVQDNKANLKKFD